MYRVRDWLYIGKYAETRNLELLRGYGINAMLQLAEFVSQPGITTLYMPIEDGDVISDKAIKRGIAFLSEEKAAGSAILCACGAGISRSTTFAIAALMEEESLSLWDAYRAIYEVHPDASPHPILVQSLARYYGESLTLEAIWDNLLAIRDKEKE